jgi:hypothetical protein
VSSDLRDIEDLSTENTRAAQIVLAMIPILCVYPFLQRYSRKALSSAPLKGRRAEEKQIMDEPLNLYIVSHTHWDREWYYSFHATAGGL